MTKDECDGVNPYIAYDGLVWWYEPLTRVIHSFMHDAYNLLLQFQFQKSTNPSPKTTAWVGRPAHHDLNLQPPGTEGKWGTLFGSKSSYIRNPALNCLSPHSALRSPPLVSQHLAVPTEYESSCPADAGILSLVGQVERDDHHARSYAGQGRVFRCCGSWCWCRSFIGVRRAI